MNHRIWAYPGLAALGLGVGMWRPGQGVRIDFLRVGQGDCTVVRDGDWTVVIDAAARSENLDLGRRLAAPELRRLGVRSINLLVITHPDSDHIGGLEAVASRFRVGALAMPETFRGHPAVQGFLGRASGRLPVFWLRAGDTARLDRARLRFDFLPLRPGEDENDGSLVTMVEAGRGRALLMADVGLDQERELAGKGEWRAEVLKVGHHGSRSSTGSEWLRLVRPRWAVISSGLDNRYGHPHQEVLARLGQVDAVPTRTDLEGTISFRLGPAGFEPIP